MTLKRNWLVVLLALFCGCAHLGTPTQEQLPEGPDIGELEPTFLWWLLTLDHGKFPEMIIENESVEYRARIIPPGTLVPRVRRDYPEKEAVLLPAADARHYRTTWAVFIVSRLDKTQTGAQLESMGYFMLMERRADGMYHVRWKTTTQYYEEMQDLVQRLVPSYFELFPSPAPPPLDRTESTCARPPCDA